jgi:RNA recognition motif-containing protein
MDPTTLAQYSSTSTSGGLRKRNQEKLNYDGSGETAIGKRSKLENSPTISKTLHVRNLPPDCTEQDLIAIACPFGRVVNVLLLKGKNQGLIQLQDADCAAALVQYYSSVGASIRFDYQLINESEENETETWGDE